MFRISCRPAPLQGRDGEDDLADVVPFHGLGNVPAAAHNAHALQNAAVLGRVVVDETGHPAVEMTADGVFPDQLPPGLACADDHYVFGALLAAGHPVAQIPHAPIEKPDTGGDKEAAQQAPYIVRPGHHNVEQLHASEAQPAQDDIGQDDPHQRVHADKPPDAVIEVA